MTVYIAQVIYWHGESLDSSEPAYDESPQFRTRPEAESWGFEKAGTPSPWPGRDYELQVEVTEYDEVSNHGVPDLEAVTRWVYLDGTLMETVKDGL